MEKIFIAYQMRDFRSDSKNDSDCIKTLQNDRL